MALSPVLIVSAVGTPLQVGMAGLANLERGSQVAGSRGYFLTGMGVMLNQVRRRPLARGAPEPRRVFGRQRCFGRACKPHERGVE
jgi:hypothetical protein